MATFDAIADLPLEIESCEFEGLEISDRRIRTADDHDQAAAAAARRGSAKTSSTTPSTTSPSRTHGPPEGLDRSRHLRRASPSSSAGSTSSRPRRRSARRLAPTTAAGPSSRRRSTWRCARPGPTSPRRSAASRGRSTSSARCGSPARRGRALLDRAAAGPARRLPDAALQARPLQRLGRRADRRAGRDRRGRLARPQGLLQRHPGRRRSPTPSSTRS